MTGVFAPLTAVHVANALVNEREAADLGGSANTLHFNYLWELKLLDRLAEWREVTSASLALKGALA
jgi:hypothetical protein